MGRAWLGTAARGRNGSPRNRVRSRPHTKPRQSSRLRSPCHTRPRRSTRVRSRRRRRSSRSFRVWRRGHKRLRRSFQVRRPGRRLRCRPVVRLRRVILPSTRLDPRSARRPRPRVRPGSASRHPRERRPPRGASLRRRPISGPRTFRIRPWLALDPRRSSLSLRNTRSGSWTRLHRPTSFGPRRRRRQPQGHLGRWTITCYRRATIRMQRSSLLPRGPGGWRRSLRAPPILLSPRVGRFPPMRLEVRKVSL